MKKRRTDKGFTLVELIVVLVILAILAAILVPALLGYIDKAREKQVTTNAEAAYVAAQAIYTEAYGKRDDGSKDDTTILPGQVPAAAVKVAPGKAFNQKILDLTDINEDFTVTITTGAADSTKSESSDKEAGLQHKDYIISKFVYENADYIATWEQATGGNWTVVKKGSGS